MHQQIVLIGNLGTDPEMRYTAAGAAVTSFSAATNKSITTSTGEKKNITTWFRISAWGSLAETCNQYLKKGARVFVQGELSPDPETGGPRTWTDKEGNVRSSYEVRADRVIFLTPRTQAQGEANAPAADDDIPF